MCIYVHKYVPYTLIASTVYIVSMDTVHCGYMFPFDIDFLWSTGNLLQLFG